MALETGEYVTDLVITNPPGSDPKSQGDDHLRLLKKTIQQTFPNMDAPVSLTAAKLNTAITEDGGVVTGNLFIGSTVTGGLGNLQVRSAAASYLTVAELANGVQTYLGADSSNAAIVGALSNHDLQLRSNNITALTLDTLQNANFAGNVNIEDNGHLNLGSNNDFDIYHDGFLTYFLNEESSASTQFWNRDSVGSQKLGFTVGGAIPGMFIYDNGILRLNTNTLGIKVTGELEVTGKLKVTGDLETAGASKLTGTINNINMPTNDSGLVQGDLWADPTNGYLVRYFL